MGNLKNTDRTVERIMLGLTWISLIAFFITENDATIYLFGAFCTAWVILFYLNMFRSK
jgi:hypothetical protein